MIPPYSLVDFKQFRHSHQIDAFSKSARGLREISLQTRSVLLQRIDAIRSVFYKSPQNIEAPEVWVAALRSGIASQVMSKADGLILNFCQPRTRIKSRSHSWKQG